ncbi:MAG: hypothetical protein V9G08_04915 [Dermatophilaceae bacterium]
MSLTSVVSPPREHPERRLAATAAVGALVALLAGGSLMAIPRPGPAQGSGWPGALALLGPAALAAISCLDMFTVPALHRSLRLTGPTLVLVATGCALVGDLLGVTGRLAQLTSVLADLRGLPGGAVLSMDLLQVTLNTAGFLLISVSFAAFGVLFVRAGSPRLGGVAVAAGVLTAVGQLPGLQVLFYVANAAFLAWYAALAVTFGRAEVAR